MTIHDILVASDHEELAHLLDLAIADGWTLHSWQVTGDAPRRVFYALVVKHNS